jgi:hypothetical protein
MQTLVHRKALFRIYYEEVVDEILTQKKFPKVSALVYFVSLKSAVSHPFLSLSLSLSVCTHTHTHTHLGLWGHVVPPGRGKLEIAPSD